MGLEVRSRKSFFFFWGGVAHPPPINKLYSVCMEEVVCAQTQCKFIWIQQGNVGCVVNQLVLGLKAKENVEAASVSLYFIGRKDTKLKVIRKKEKPHRWTSHLNSTF